MSDGASRRSRPPLAVLEEGVRRGDRTTLARAITLIESQLEVDRELARELLRRVLPHTGSAYRIGITGVPGAGKSTFIDALGMHAIQAAGQKVAVLSIDPSSEISGGSILGDKTRMHRLTAEADAFIRPSPARGHLGGVARRTREAILLCEAAGFTRVFVETVGIGQSETAVGAMTDFVLLLMIPGAGDELQGMKRGIIEMLDGMVINKADGERLRAAHRAAAEYKAALHLYPPRADGWQPRVVTCSAQTGAGIPEVWQMLEDYRMLQMQSGLQATRRAGQNEAWLHELLEHGLLEMFEKDGAVQARLPDLLHRVRNGRVAASEAADELLRVFRPGRN